jgi:NADH dehydrogenase FAD-containing subunit
MIIGGGPVGVELSGEIAYKFQNKQISLIHSRERILNYLKPKASILAEQQLLKLGVKIILKERVKRLSSNKNYISQITGKIYKADLVYVCTGLNPNTDFMKKNFSQSLTENGSIKVDRYLRVTGVNNMFAVGDCNDVKETKLGFLANNQGSFTAKNLQKILKKEKEIQLKPYREHKTISLVTTGRETGISQLSFLRQTFVTKNKFLTSFKQKDLFIGRSFKKLSTIPDILPY